MAALLVQLVVLLDAVTGISAGCVLSPNQQFQACGAVVAKFSLSVHVVTAAVRIVPLVLPPVCVPIVPQVLPVVVGLLPPLCMAPGTTTISVVRPSTTQFEHVPFTSAPTSV